MRRIQYWTWERLTPICLAALREEEPSRTSLTICRRCEAESFSSNDIQQRRQEGIRAPQAVALHYGLAPLTLRYAQRPAVLGTSLPSY